jgi:hypothetical protein
MCDKETRGFVLALVVCGMLFACYINTGNRDYALKILAWVQEKLITSKNFFTLLWNTVTAWFSKDVPALQNFIRTSVALPVLVWNGYATIKLVAATLSTYYAVERIVDILCVIVSFNRSFISFVGKNKEVFAGLAALAAVGAGAAQYGLLGGEHDADYSNDASDANA